VTRFPAWRKVPEFTVFASLLRMTTKYGFSDAREQLVDGIKGAYPTGWEGLGTGVVLGEDIFGSPKPHKNAVLNLFTEQSIKFALPFAAYRAALGGFSSLISDEPGTVLPRRMLASTVYGMEVIRSKLAMLAHVAVCDMGLEGCSNTACAANAGINPPDQRREELAKIYLGVVNGGAGGMLSPPSLGNTVCANCAKKLETPRRRWCEMTWEKLPHIFGVGNSWEEL
jgi:hypothetical protein